MPEDLPDLSRLNHIRIFSGSLPQLNRLPVPARPLPPGSLPGLPAGLSLRIASMAIKKDRLSPVLKIVLQSYCKFYCNRTAFTAFFYVT